MSMSYETTQSETTTALRQARGRKARLGAMAVALIATVNWCNPPTFDIKFDRNNSGRMAAVVADAPSGVI